MKKNTGIILSLALLLTCCRETAHQKNFESGPIIKNGITVSGQRFVDSYGREVILSGINKVNKNPDDNYIDKDSVELYKVLSGCGFNVIRLGVIWDGVEPEPGVYDEKYLDEIEKRVSWAADNGLYVMLDMHQDLYGVSLSENDPNSGDGAPVWATITENQPHFKGEIWSDSYFISPAVQKAFDNLWANAPAPDGIGLQDHYAGMWRHIAERFSGNKAVIGYDLMNEPFNGTQGAYILPVILSEYTKLFAEKTGKILTEQEVTDTWASEEKRLEALSFIEDAESYGRVIDAATGLSQQFEKNVLGSFYQKVANAIREVDTSHILFLEHAYFGNTGISSAIEPVRRADGSPDPLVGYAAHGYDLLTDTKNVQNQGAERVKLIFSRINDTGKRMNVPVLIGEWGAFGGNSPELTLATRNITGIFQEYLFSNTFWAYYDNILKEGFFVEALVRPYPKFTSGKLISYSFDNETGNFEMKWKEDPGIKAPSEVFIPFIDRLQKETLILTPGNEKIIVEAIKGTPNGHIIISPSGDATGRTLSFNMAPGKP